MREISSRQPETESIAHLLIQCSDKDVLPVKMICYKTNNTVVAGKLTCTFAALISNKITNTRPKGCLGNSSKMIVT